MATNEIDHEVKAIGSLLKTLEPLSAEARRAALEYVVKRLGIDLPATGGGGPSEAVAPIHAIQTSQVPTEDRATAKPTHIKELKEQKEPKSANEMVALVAYYLSHDAPEKDRKETIGRHDLEQYFKIAGYRLPKDLPMALVNAKAAGYVDSAGRGRYKLRRHA